MTDDTYSFSPCHRVAVPSSPTPGQLSSQRLALNQQSWFHGSISRTEAERRIRLNGQFLVRESHSHGRIAFVVTIKWNGSHLHVIIQTSVSPNGQVEYKFESKDYTFPTVAELIQYYQENQLPFAVRSEAALYRPLSTTDVVPSSHNRIGISSSGSKRRTMLSPALSRIQNSKLQMQRYGSEDLLLSTGDTISNDGGSDKNLSFNNNDIHRKQSEPNGLGYPLHKLDNSNKVHSLSDLNQPSSDDSSGSSRHSVQARLETSTTPPQSNQPKKPPVMRRSAFVGVTKFHNSYVGGLSSGNTSGSFCDDDSSSDYTDYNMVKDFSKVEQMEAKKTINIQKGRYLEMVDKISIPITNPALWRTSSPTTPTNKDFSFNSSLKPQSNNCSPSSVSRSSTIKAHSLVDDSDSAIYMDMGFASNHLSGGGLPNIDEALTPVPPLSNSKSSSETVANNFNFSDIYGDISDFRSPSPPRTPPQPPPPLIPRRRMSAGHDKSYHSICVSFWRQCIKRTGFVWHEDLGLYRSSPDAGVWCRNVQRPFDVNALTHIRSSLLEAVPEDVGEVSDKWASTMGATIANQLVLEDARVLVQIGWPVDSLEEKAVAAAQGLTLAQGPPGVDHGFALLLLPEARQYREDILTRYKIMSQFVMACIVTEADLTRRLRLLHLWLHVAQCLAHHRNFFSLGAVCGALFSPQIKMMSSTLNQLSQNFPLVFSLFTKLEEEHINFPLTENMSLTQCVPNVGQLATYISQCDGADTGPSLSEINPSELQSMLTGLDSQMAYLTMASDWFSTKRQYNSLWLQKLAATLKPEPQWISLFRTESMMTLLLGPNKIVRSQLPQLCDKVDRAIFMFAQNTDLLVPK